MRNAGLDEAQAGMKIARRNTNNLRYEDDTTLMAESEELKSLSMKVKEESENFGLKLNIQKTQRNQRSNCQHLLDHNKKQANSRKSSTSVSLTILKPLT